MINIAVGGANGKMGKEIIAAIEAKPDTNCAAKIDRVNTLHHFLSESQPQNQSRSISHPIDIFIDFTTPASTMEHIKLCQKNSIPIVIGTTGFTEKEKKDIADCAKTIPILLSPNMSIGVNVCFQLLEMAAKLLKEKAEIAIHEIHHKHKKDAPSGTALKMGEMIAKGLKTDNANSESRLGSRSDTKSEEEIKTFPVTFSSLRLGDIVGDHTAVFALEGERIEITHRSETRTIYASGAVLAAEWLVNQKPGLYDMQNVIGR